MPYQNLQQRKNTVKTSLYKSKCMNAPEIIIEACHYKTDKICEDSDQPGHLMASKKKKYLCEDGIERSVPRDRRLSSLQEIFQISNQF